tara:strand:+ start:584 stop:1063 length:480 start_codon:yes stop_codon:yes gene_type:complete
MPKKTKKGNVSIRKPNKTERLIEGMRANVHPRQIKEIISYMPQPTPRKGSVLQLNRTTDEMGKLGKVIEKNDTTKKAIVRLFYNGYDRVLNYSQLQPKGNNKEKPAKNYFDPYKMPDSYNMDRLRSPIPVSMRTIPKNTTIKKSKSRSKSRSRSRSRSV